MVKLRVHRCPTSKALINLFILCPLGFCSASTVPLSTCLLFLPTCFLSCPYCLPSVYFFTISALSVLCIVMFPSLLWPAVFGVLLYASAYTFGIWYLVPFLCAKCEVCAEHYFHVLLTMYMQCDLSCIALGCDLFHFVRGQGCWAQIHSGKSALISHFLGTPVNISCHIMFSE